MADGRTTDIDDLLTLLGTGRWNIFIFVISSLCEYGLIFILSLTITKLQIIVNNYIHTVNYFFHRGLSKPYTL